MNQILDQVATGRIAVTPGIVSALAHEFWIERGRPNGTPEIDYDRAVISLTVMEQWHRQQMAMRAMAA